MSGRPPVRVGLIGAGSIARRALAVAEAVLAAADRSWVTVPSPPARGA